jgi:hypothetical protein
MSTIISFSCSVLHHPWSLAASACAIWSSSKRFSRTQPLRYCVKLELSTEDSSLDRRYSKPQYVKKLLNSQTKQPPFLQFVLFLCPRVFRSLRRQDQRPGKCRKVSLWPIHLSPCAFFNDATRSVIHLENLQYAIRLEISRAFPLFLLISALYFHSYTR